MNKGRENMHDFSLSAGRVNGTWCPVRKQGRDGFEVTVSH